MRGVREWGGKHEWRYPNKECQECKSGKETSKEKGVGQQNMG